MKKNVFTLSFLLLVSFVFSQNIASVSFEAQEKENYSIINTNGPIGTNGYNYTVENPGDVNSKYTELGSGFFKEKFIMISSKKIGGLAKKDQNTNEGFKNVYCLELFNDGRLEDPNLFSRFVNTEGSEGQISFSPDENTMYFTRAKIENSLIYEIYKMTLGDESLGTWINEEKLSINLEGYSIENPHVSRKGDELYFSSNRPNGRGGYDLYVAPINEDGTLGEPKNLGNKINTAADDKFPSLSVDGKDLYFSSKGHKTLGGYDVFKSKITKNGYTTPINLGTTLNTTNDEVAYFMASKTKGYISTNKSSGKGSYDVYKFFVDVIYQNIEGMVVQAESKEPLDNVVLTLLDENGNELESVTTNKDASYTFMLEPQAQYTIVATKDGFEDATKTFIATNNNVNETTITKNIELVSNKPITVETTKVISVENIYFDFAKWDVRETSFITLDKVITILNENPELKIKIDAHTDNRSSDQFNYNLSEKRAAAAKAYLIKNGINPERLLSTAYGETNPFIDCKNKCNEDEHQSNRRVEFVILD